VRNMPEGEYKWLTPPPAEGAAPAESSQSFLNSPLFWIIIILIITIIIVWYIMKGRKKGEFKPQPLHITFQNELNEKIKTFGIDFKWGSRLIRDFNKVAILDRYFIGKIKMPLYTFHPKTKDFIVEKEDKDIEGQHMIVRVKNSFFLWRWLGMKKIFYCLDMKFNEKLFRFDGQGNLLILGQIDITFYGRVWCLTESDIEYMSNVSIKRMVEQTNMWLENNPDRIIHLDSGQAKIDRTNRNIAELERSKYEERKNIGDTTVT